MSENQGIELMEQLEESRVAVKCLTEVLAAMVGPSTRDYFAGLAMQALIAGFIDDGAGDTIDATKLSLAAYKIAGEMVKERNDGSN